MRDFYTLRRTLAEKVTAITRAILSVAAESKLNVLVAQWIKEITKIDRFKSITGEFAPSDHNSSEMTDVRYI